MAFPRQPEPIETVASNREQVWQLADPREAHPAEQLNRLDPLPFTQVKLDWLRKAGEIVHAEHEIVAELSDIGEHARVAAPKIRERAEPKSGILLAHLDHAACPVQERGRVSQLCL